MKRILVVILAGVLPLVFSACLKEKVLEIIISAETFADFSENETSASWTSPALVDMAQALRDALEENGYSLSDIKMAHLTSGSYGVLTFAQADDWTISGSIQVRRDDIPSTDVNIINYASVSIQAALGAKITAPLQSAGVDLINQAIDDFLAGGSPTLVFTVNNGSVVPTPSVSDPIVFDWRAWIAIQIQIDESLDVPDPF